MKVAVMTDIMEMEMMERPKPEVKDNEVMVKVKHCGVCGSDVHFYEQGRIGGFIVEPPFVLGHECAGEVVEIGSAVKKFKVGDLVAIEPGRVCNTCEACKSGRYNLCPEMEFYATPPCDGAFAEFVTAPEDMTYMLPEGMSTLEGALLEPLAVGFQAVTRGKATVGQSAVVLGSGCIGLCTMMALHARGVNTVYMVDVIPMRLEMAKKLGAAGVVNAKEENTIEAIKKLTESQKSFAENLETVKDIHASTDALREVDAQWKKVSDNIDLIASQ
ncbi:MAG: alcohol dehydrogenase catalytic domain-containing protein, partial [Eubacterium sp.]